jgi:hypothetical protein
MQDSANFRELSLSEQARAKLGETSGDSYLALSFPELECRGFRPAADAKILPQSEPWTLRKHFVVPSICSGDVACAERANIRRFEHFL